MIRRLVSCLIGSLLIVGAGAASAADRRPDAGTPAAAIDEVPAPIRGLGYRLVKDWDFSRRVRSLDELHREFFTRFKNANGTLDTLAGNGEWQRYSDNDNHRIENGVLELIARPRAGLRPGGIESGMLRSKWTGKYGYFEVRMKVPSGRGLWPAFWLVADDERWPPEIDVVEIVDNGRDTTRQSFHNVQFGRNPVRVAMSKLDRYGSYRPGFDYADGFHTFAVEWTPQLVRHYVDDVLLAERYIEWRHDDGSDAGPAHLLINLAVGGNWPGAPDGNTRFPAVLEVAYIRVWQKS